MCTPQSIPLDVVRVPTPAIVGTSTPATISLSWSRRCTSPWRQRACDRTTGSRPRQDRWRLDTGRSCGTTGRRHTWAACFYSRCQRRPCSPSAVACASVSATIVCARACAPMPSAMRQPAACCKKIRRRFSEVMILRFMMPTFQIRWTIPEVIVKCQACCRISSSSSSCR